MLMEPDPLPDAVRTAIGTIQDYLNGDWDGNTEGWQAVVDRLQSALEVHDAITP